MRVRFWLMLVASIVLGIVLVAAGIGKLLGHSAFLIELNATGFLPPWFAGVAANWLPLAEIVIGLALLSGTFTQLAAMLSTLLFAAFGFNNIWAIAHGLGYQSCSCFGIFEKIFQGKLSTTNALYVDIGMFVLALVVYFAWPGKFTNIRPWYFRKKMGTSVTLGSRDISLAPEGKPQQE